MSPFFKSLTLIKSEKLKTPFFGDTAQHYALQFYLMRIILLYDLTVFNLNIHTLSYIVFKIFNTLAPPCTVT